MTDAAKTISSTTVTDPKFTAQQIKTACPDHLQRLGNEIAARIKKVDKQIEQAEYHSISISKLITQTQKLCDGGGFHAFQKKFLPDLGKSRAYELLAIGTNKKSVKEIRASSRARVAKYRANKAAAPVSVTVTERTDPVAQGTSKEYRKIEALSIASEYTPEPAKPRSAVAPGDEIMRVFTVQVMELNRRTAKRPPERFSASAVPVEVLARPGNFLTHLANLKNNAAKIDAGHRRTQQRCNLGWAFGGRYGCKMLRWMFRFRRASKPRRGCSPAGAGR